MQSRNVVDLHGHFGEVICMSCLRVTPRQALQSRLKLLNPSFPPEGEIAPDDDANVAEDSVSCVTVPPHKNSSGY